jgi:hypothetical protein
VYKLLCGDVEMSQEKVKLRKLNLSIEPRADDLLRLHNRRRGDLSRIVEQLIYKEYDVPQPTAQPTA